MDISRLGYIEIERQVYTCLSSHSFQAVEFVSVSRFPRINDHFDTKFQRITTIKYH